MGLLEHQRSRLFATVEEEGRSIFFFFRIFAKAPREDRGTGSGIYLRPAG